MIDARTQHDPALATILVDQATAIAGSQLELAARCGISARYLRMLSRGDKKMSYTLQVTLEAIRLE